MLSFSTGINHIEVKDVLQKHQALELVQGWDRQFRRKNLILSATDESPSLDDEKIVISINQKQKVLLEWLETQQRIWSDPSLLSILTQDAIKQHFEHFRSVIGNQILFFEQRNLPQVAGTLGRGCKFSRHISHTLKSWFFQNLSYPYPTKGDMLELSQKTALTQRQIQIWFINARGRIKSKGFARKKFKSIVKQSYLMTVKNKESPKSSGATLNASQHVSEIHI